MKTIKMIGTCLAVSMLLAPVASAAAASAAAAAPSDSARMASAAGQVASIDAASNSLVVKVIEPGAPPQDLNLVVADDSKIIKNGAAVALTDLKLGDKVTITYRPQDGKNMVVNIGVDSKS
jgi:Cu/Ag efflux protein CusF